ncbi:uncharacterized protein TNCV_597341 [Trichonephila clavipes]|nr:uncharacterized protein TNCV_597341 [Trichonephila clavipes]
MREYQAWKKTLQNTLLMPSLRDGNAIETLLMTAQINSDFVNHPVPTTTEPSTSRMRVGTDACESIVNSILRYKTMISIRMRGHGSLVVKDEVEKLAYQLNEEAERTERPIRRLSKVMYGSTCADMQVDVMGECLSSIKHVVGVRLVFLAERLHAV